MLASDHHTEASRFEDQLARPRTTENPLVPRTFVSLLRILADLIWACLEAPNRHRVVPTFFCLFTNEARVLFWLGQCTGLLCPFPSTRDGCHVWDTRGHTDLRCRSEEAFPHVAPEMPYAGLEHGRTNRSIFRLVVSTTTPQQVLYGIVYFAMLKRRQ